MRQEECRVQGTCIVGGLFNVFRDTIKHVAVSSKHWVCRSAQIEHNTNIKILEHLQHVLLLLVLLLAVIFGFYVSLDAALSLPPAALLGPQFLKSPCDVTGMIGVI